MKYGLEIRCSCSRPRIVPASQLARPCSNCGDMQTIRMIQLPDDPQETLPWGEVKEAFNSFEAKISCVVDPRPDESFAPIWEEDEWGHLRGIYSLSKFSRLWCSPCLSALWERAKARYETRIPVDKES